METVRQWGKIVYLLLVEGGKNMPSFSSGSICVNCEAEPKFLLDWSSGGEAQLLPAVNCHKWQLKKSPWMLSSPFLGYTCCVHLWIHEFSHFFSPSSCKELGYSSDLAKCLLILFQEKLLCLIASLRWVFPASHFLNSWLMNYLTVTFPEQFADLVKKVSLQHES